MLLVVHLAVLCAVAAGIGAPRVRRHAAALLLATVLGALGWAVAQPADTTRTLEVTAPFAAFVGADPGRKEFRIETTEAPAAYWAFAVAAWCAAWAAVLWLSRPRAERRGTDFHPFFVPLLFAWTALTLGLALEKLAAPEDLVRPVPFERVLLPACVAAAVLFALRCRSLPLALAWQVLFVAVSRLPLALFGALATKRSWGTSLDVHSIVHFANPMTQDTISVAPGSGEQIGWQIVAPHLFVIPALYVISTGGVVLATTMFARGIAAARREA